MSPINSLFKKPAWQSLFNFKKNSGLPLLFILLIFLPMADMIFMIGRPLPIREKRKLAPRPQFALQKPWDYLKKYEAYFNDHFGFRGQLLYYHNRFMVQLLATSPTDKVMIGRCGWLFMAKESQTRNELDYFRSLKLFSSEELQHWRSMLKQRREWLAGRGIAYVFVVVPNKSTIYSEFMPGNIRRLHRQSRLDQLLAALKQEDDFPVIDLRETLLAAKRSYRIYNKTDSHWNDLGAYFAYVKIMEKLAVAFPGLRPAPLNDFIVESQDRIGGDLAMMLSLQKNQFHEQVIRLQPKSPVFSESVPGNRKLGPYIRESISACPSGALPPAVMVHDSFIHQLRPLLTPHFQRISYIWDWDLNFYPDVIDRENSKIVIEEMAERALEDLQLRNPDFPVLPAAGKR